MKWPYELGASLTTLQSEFDLVVAQFERPLVQFLHRFVFRTDVALDLAQESFVKAYQNLHRYDSARPFSTWLFSIASNLAKDYLRRQGRLVPMDGVDSAAEEAAPLFLRPDRQLQAAELGAAMEEAVAALPLLLREPLLLRHTAGLSVEETAEALGVSTNVVKVRLFRARQKLQEMLGKEWLGA